MALAVGGAFHTPLMAAAQEHLEDALAKTAFADGACPVVANVDAAPHTAGAEWPALLSSQLCRPVRWREGTAALVALGVTRAVELGPGAVLSGLVKRTAPSLERVSIASPADLG
jgi:[acyl-carrier-protein] S-malonyltransferase